MHDDEIGAYIVHEERKRRSLGKSRDWIEISIEII